VSPEIYIIPIITKKIRNNPKEIHKGERTHHQDQVITLFSLRITNKTVRSAGKLGETVVVVLILVWE
jgi:hypothetical protein